MSRTAVEGYCPCGGTFHAEIAADNSQAFVAHSEPTCVAFHEREPDMYLRWVREQLTKGAPKE